jgi:hypothetical protein
VIIQTDVTDWAETALISENFPQTRDELETLAVTTGAKLAAQTAIAGRAMGQVPVDLISEDKALLSDGGALSIHLMLATAKTEIEVNGKMIRGRKWKAIQRPPETDAGDDGERLEANIEDALPDHGYTEFGTVESVANAISYLMRFVLGHIWNRLAEIKAGGGDVVGAATALIEKINEMVDKLENGG